MEKQDITTTYGYKRYPRILRHTPAWTRKVYVWIAHNVFRKLGTYQEKSLIELEWGDYFNQK